MAKSEIIKSPLDFADDSITKQGSVTNILQNLQQELDKIKGKVQGDSHSANLTLVEYYVDNHFAGNLHTSITTLHTVLNVFESLGSGT